MKTNKAMAAVELVDGEGGDGGGDGGGDASMRYEFCFVRQASKAAIRLTQAHSTTVEN